MALSKLKAENDALEKEIMALTKGDTKTMGGTKTMVPSSGSSIKVLNFGNNVNTNEAGINHGSAWCPPQCARRTVLGGFFTS